MDTHVYQLDYSNDQDANVTTMSTVNYAGLPLPVVISWQAFMISRGPPAFPQVALLLIRFFWRTESIKKISFKCQISLSLFNACNFNLTNQTKWNVLCVTQSFFSSPHLCCRVLRDERWNTPFVDQGTVTSCIVSRRSPAEGDTDPLCSTPGSPACAACLWCSGTKQEGTAAPGCVQE